MGMSAPTSSGSALNCENDAMGHKQTSAEIYFDQPLIHVIPIQRSAQRCTL
jgi:hypothetical protein